MTIEMCLFLRPETGEPTEIGSQNQDFEHIVEPAVRLAGLRFSPPGGAVVDDVNEDLVAQVWTADLVLVDANRYGGDEAPALSPYLAYYIALRHARGNRTILIARNDGHLPPALRQHHTLTYDPARPQRFYKTLERVVEAIRTAVDQEVEERPDNPVQIYLRNLQVQAKAEQAEQLRAALEEQQAELERLRQDRAQGAPGPTRIRFRPVN